VKLGGFDPGFSMYLEETEWQKRMADAGYERWFVADSSVTHYGSAQKSFAQASRHYLWGLELYTRKHWRGPFRRGRLLLALWMGSVISVILLLILWPISYIAGRAGQRIRHYGKQYVRVIGQLLMAPTQPPA
jgi:GT2 family glycosyltransferase